MKTDAFRDAGQEAECGRGAREEFEVDQGFEPQPADLEEPPQRAQDNFFEAAGIDGQDIFPGDQVVGIEDEPVFIKDEEVNVFAAELSDRVPDGGTRENGRALLGEFDKEQAFSAGGGGFWKQATEKSEAFTEDAGRAADPPVDPLKKRGIRSQPCHQCTGKGISQKRIEKVISSGDPPRNSLHRREDLVLQSLAVGSMTRRSDTSPDFQKPTFPMSQFPARLILLAALAVFVVGCASSGPQVDPAVTAAATARGVNPGTVLKMSNARVLDYDDIVNLVSKGVSSNTIVAYLNSTRKVYDFSYAQLAGLKSAGATPQLLNYLTETQGFYGNNSPRQKARVAKMQKDQYYNSPYYQDKQPFAYNAPAIDDWYDSGYEESLYSPFSFNN